MLAQADPYTQIGAGLEQFVILTRVTSRSRNGGRSTNTTAHAADIARLIRR